VIRNVINELLQLDMNDEIDIENNFGEIGFNSLTLVAFIQALNDKFHINLRETIAFDYPNINELAKFIGSQIDEKTIAMDSILEDEKKVEVKTSTLVELKTENSSSKINLDAVLLDVMTGNIAIDDALTIIN